MIIFYSVRPRTYFLCTLRTCKKALLPTITVKIQNKYSTCQKKHQIPKNGPWNVLFFGTDEFAVESLKTLYSKYESKVLTRLEVVTTCRGKAVSKYATQKGININKWPLENSISNFHIGIVVSFGHMIPTTIINSFPLGMLNVHGSLLPRWRGAAPIVYSLLNGDQQTGITIMKILPKKFDIGDIVLQKQIDINENDTFPDLYIRLAKLGAELLGDTFNNLPELLASAKPQDNTNVTYAPKITSKIAIVKWNEMTAKNVYDLYRALIGLCTLVTTFQDKRVKLHHIENIEEPIATKLEGATPAATVKQM
ncbi:methionyl-tRNA formyltransferase, mitochondrial isoform X2 [Calliopsis andreniformis]|uniref:methionyl-tRNA formyltransferase, mitochondrial isoform X2 n=1 Tax=Calliopsis andreniformis TaxID=337506 RepID=UPI003FCE620F